MYFNIKLVQEDSKNIMDSSPDDICPEHLQRLDIVCLTDRKKICTKCALFGSHKQHDFRTLEDVLKEVTEKADQIMEIYQQIQTKQAEFSEQKCVELLQDKFRKILKESQQAVRDKFAEIHQIFTLKEQKLTDQLTTIINTLENQNKKQICETLGQCQSQVELWKITAKDRLLSFTSASEMGQLSLDLVSSDFGCLESGTKILEEISKTVQAVETKLQNIKIKKLKIDFKKKELEKTLDSLFTLTLQMSGTQIGSKKKNQNNNSQSESMLDSTMDKKDNGDQSVRFQKTESLSKLLAGDVFQSFCCEDPNLLKDVSFADWSEIQSEFDDSPVQSTIVPQDSPKKQDNLNQSLITPSKQVDLTKLQNPRFQSRNFETKQSFETTSFTQQQMQPGQSPPHRYPPRIPLQEDSKNQVQQRQGVSPTTKIGVEKKKKNVKIPEKFDQLFLALKNDVLEIADFSNAELQDEGIIMLSEYLKSSKKLKQFKAVRNRISDDGACRVFDALAQNPNQVFVSLHLQSNLVSEKSLDYLLSLQKQITNGSLPNNLYLNQNLINQTKTKRKIEELKKNGITITV